MRTLTVLVALMIMVRLSGQETENSMRSPAGPDKVLVIFTYYRQFLPDLEGVTLFSNDRVLYGTYYNRIKQGLLRNIKSHVTSAVELIFRLAFDKKSISDLNEKEIIIPVNLADGRSLYLFPEHRLIIAYKGSAHALPRIKPILITESRLSVWLRITL